MNWTDERTELLKKLWADGLSADQIAAELGGISRNSVIGKVHRLGLESRRPSASSRRQKGAAPVLPLLPRVRKRKPAVTIALAPAESFRCTIMDLDNGRKECRWPIGDPCSPDFLFCGGKTITGLPYCGYHARIAYQPAGQERRKESPAIAAQ